MKIDHGRFKLFVAQVVFDVGQRCSGEQQVDGTAMPEAVSRIDVFQLFRVKAFFQMNATGPIDAMPSDLFPALI